MGDQLEQFIIKNKDSFDDASPSDKVWSDIEKSVRKDRSYLQVAWKAAAVLFMVSTIFLLVDRSGDQPGSELSNEFQQAEVYYTKLISARRMEIKEQLSPVDQQEFLQEIDQLDVLYGELKETYQANASSERVLGAMISNLQLRLEILNKQLDILENFNEQKNESEQNISI